jgi:MFS family permease
LRRSPLGDRERLWTASALRAAGTGMSGILLGTHAAASGIGPAAAGFVVAAGLSGGALAALLVTLAGPRLPRRATLIALAALSGAGMLAYAALPAGVPQLAVAVAFVGMLNGMGRDRGAALVLETAALPSTVPPAKRTKTFAVFTMLQDVGHAVGSLVAAMPFAFPVAAALLAAPAVLYAGLSPAVEVGPSPPRRAQPATRRVLWKIAPLFALDSVGGGFLTTSLLSYFFFERFGVGVTALGALFFAARLLNAGSHLAAAWLAERIGLVPTMVFTHLPSSLLLATVPFAPSFGVAAVLFLLREGLVEMDVPTRQSYVMAVVAPEDRTLASGVTHLVRLGGWAAGPLLAGALMQGLSLATPLFFGAGLKVAYDLLLWRAFRGRDAA